MKEFSEYFKNQQDHSTILEALQNANNQLLKLLTLSCIFKNYTLCQDILKKIKLECINIRCCIYLPITHAALNGNEELVSLLIESGVSIPLAAIIKSAQRNHYKITAKLLLLILGYEIIF